MSDDQIHETDTAGAPDASPRAQERAARKAAKASEKAARAQARADAARREALEAAVAGGLIDSPAEERRQRPAETVAPAPSYPAERAPRAPMDPARRKVITTLLLVVALVMAALAAWGAVAWKGAADDKRAEVALAGSPDAATEAAKGIVTDMFTYDWQSIGPKMDAVEPRLTGDAEKEFRTSSRPAVESAAKEQKASVFSTVAAIAPIEIVDTDHIRELVMLNRMVSTEKDPKAQSASSRIEVLMTRVDGQWKLEKLKAI